MQKPTSIQQLDLNLLKVFESLYLEQNMTRTAEALFITPSAVSHAIKRLRECLNDPLFQRVHNKMLPTPACQRLAPLLIENLNALRQALQQWHEFDPQTSQQHFRIGIHDALEPALLPTLVQRLNSLAPSVQLSSIKVDRQSIARELTTGQIDIAINVAIPLKPPIQHKQLLDDVFCILVRKNHPFINENTKEKYLEATHISVSNRSSGPSVEDFIFQQQGLVRNIGIRCQNFYATRSILANSDLLLTVPRTIGEELKTEELTLLPIPINIAPVMTHVYWHENAEQNAALIWLRDLLFELSVT
ncbi:LysR family transcriptional regulator [Alteromonadaceae bacterium M269]|nr:LysR family transcriptional regulator [Alteromonadaceae bacterium M269]